MTKVIPNASADDHILGKPGAPIIVIEYTDLECPYCKSFHFTMKAIMDVYGKRGDVAWIIRNFPVPQLHPRAIKEHEGAECAALLGGNSAFFAFVDKVFDRTPSNNGLNPDLLPVIAAEIGLKKSEFNDCLESGKFTEKVKRQAAEAFASGATGTPHNVILFQGEKIALPGAQPYQSMRSLLDTLLARNSGETNAIPRAQL